MTMLRAALEEKDFVVLKNGFGFDLLETSGADGDDDIVEKVGTLLFTHKLVSCQSGHSSRPLMSLRKMKFPPKRIASAAMANPMPIARFWIAIPGMKAQIEFISNKKAANAMMSDITAMPTILKTLRAGFTTFLVIRNLREVGAVC